MFGCGLHTASTVFFKGDPTMTIHQTANYFIIGHLQQSMKFVFNAPLKRIDKQPVVQLHSPQQRRPIQSSLSDFSAPWFSQNLTVDTEDVNPSGDGVTHGVWTETVYELMQDIIIRRRGW